MNRSIRGLGRAAVPVLATAVAAATATPAYPAEGVRGTGDPVADTVRDVPVVVVPAVVVDVPAAAGSITRALHAKSIAQGAMARLGGGVLPGAGTDLAFTGITVTAVPAADGTVRCVTKIIGGRLTGAGVPGLAKAPAVPAVPASGLRLPTADRNVFFTLNDQVRDGAGGSIVRAVSTNAGGVTRAIGVVRCLPAKRITDRAATLRKPGMSDPVRPHMPAPTLPVAIAALSGSIGGLLAAPDRGAVGRFSAMLGGLSGLPLFLPALIKALNLPATPDLG